MSRMRSLAMCIKPAPVEEDREEWIQSFSVIPDFETEDTADDSSSVKPATKSGKPIQKGSKSGNGRRD